MRKIFALMLAIAMVLTMVACGKKADNKADSMVTPELYISTVDGKDTVVDKDGKAVTGYTLDKDGNVVDGSGKLLSGTPVYPDEETLAKRLSQSGTGTGWSQNYQCPYIRYTDENGDHWFAFYENGDSLRAKCQAAALLGITGVSYWRLGTIPAERLGL